MSFIESFISEIKNAKTRQIYSRSIYDFEAWCNEHGITDLKTIGPADVAAWAAYLDASGSASSAMQRLAAIRALFDWLIAGKEVIANPARTVRGPLQHDFESRSHYRSDKESSSLVVDDVWRLLASIPSDTIDGKRDRAMIGLMIYALAQSTAVVSMNAGDVYARGEHLWINVRIKNQRQEILCEESLASVLKQYIDASGVATNPEGPLFRSLKRGTGQLGDARLPPSALVLMVQRRARAAGITSDFGIFNLRAAGIAARLASGAV